MERSGIEPLAEPLPEISQKAFRDAMARLGSAVHVITTDGPAGPGGFTASAVTSVTDMPPTLLVCVNRNVSSFAAMIENGAVCVNTLSARHRDVSLLFSQKVGMNERFAAAQWQRGVSGAPILADAVAAFDCEIVEVKDVGSHAVLFCRVLGLSDGSEEDAMIYFGRSYHRLGTGSRMEG